MPKQAGLNDICSDAHIWEAHFELQSYKITRGKLHPKDISLPQWD